jgi:hypothetical protein
LVFYDVGVVVVSVIAGAGVGGGTESVDEVAEEEVSGVVVVGVVPLETADPDESDPVSNGMEEVVPAPLEAESVGLVDSSGVVVEVVSVGVGAGVGSVQTLFTKVCEAVQVGTIGAGVGSGVGSGAGGVIPAFCKRVCNSASVTHVSFIQIFSFA